MQQTYEHVAVNAVQPHPDNPRRGSLDEIRKSIDTTGFYGAIIVQRSTGFVLAGNHRLQAAQAAGLEVVPAIFVDVDDVAARRILLADNRTSDLAEYDSEDLASILGDLIAESGVDSLDGTGYGMIDMDRLLNELEQEAADPTGPSLSGGKLIGGSASPHLKWEGRRVPLSSAEVEMLEVKLSSYVDETGSMFGFVTALFNGL